MPKGKGSFCLGQTLPIGGYKGPLFLFYLQMQNLRCVLAVYRHQLYHGSLLL